MSENKYTSDDLKAMQAWSLERKIMITQTRIIEWYQHYKGQVYVSFSGGKDSTVLLDLARRIYPDIEAVFVDTGLEYPELREFVKTVDNVTWLKPSMNFRKVIEAYGYPLGSKHIAQVIEDFRKHSNYVPGMKKDDIEIEGYTKKYMPNEYGGVYPVKTKFAIPKKLTAAILENDIKISNRCCTVMKKKPLAEYQRRIKKLPIIATMAEESLRREMGWRKSGCNVFTGARTISKPMSFWTGQDVLQYLKEFEIPYASVYGEIKQDESGKYYTTGCDRTGCIFCGFACHNEKEPNRFQRLKQTHPKLWEYCMKPWEQGGLGMKEVLYKIGVKSE